MVSSRLTKKGKPPKIVVKIVDKDGKPVQPSTPADAGGAADAAQPGGAAAGETPAPAAATAAAPNKSYADAIKEGGLKRKPPAKAGAERKPPANAGADAPAQPADKAAEAAPAERQAVETAPTDNTSELFKSPTFTSGDLADVLAQTTGMSVDGQADAYDPFAFEEAAAAVAADLDKMSIDAKDTPPEGEPEHAPPAPAATNAAAKERAAEPTQAEVNAGILETLKQLTGQVEALSKRQRESEGRPEREEAAKRPRPTHAGGGGQNGSRSNGGGRGAGGRGAGGRGAGGRGGGAGRGNGGGRGSKGLKPLKDLAWEYGRCFKCGKHFSKEAMKEHSAGCVWDEEAFRRRMGVVRKLVDAGKGDQVNTFPSSADK